MTDASTSPDRAPSRGFGAIAARLPDGLLDAAWLWLVLRVGLSLVALFLVVGGGVQGPCPADAHLRFLPSDGIAFPLLGAWHHWDACWYTTIAANGYGITPGTGATTFFPLLPLLASAIARVDANLAIAFSAINAIALIVALTGLRQLVARDFDLETAQRTVLYIVVFPAAFFLIAPFTESLFLAAGVWAFNGARQRKWEIAIVAGIVAGLTRPQGLIVILPVAWEAGRMVWDRWRAGGPRFRPGDVIAGLAVAAPAIAYAGFLAYTALVVRESYFESHEAWGAHRLVLPWDAVAEAIRYGLERGRAIQLLNAALWPLFVALTLAGIRLLPVSYWIYAAPQLYLAVSQDTVWPMMSLVRYLIVLFPCFVVLAIAGRHPRFHTAWLVLSTLFLGVLASAFLAGEMVG